MDFSPPCHSACFSLSRAVHHPIGMGETNDSSDMNWGGLDKTKELSHTTVDSHLKGNPSRRCPRPLGKKKTSYYCEFSFYSWGSASREPGPPGSPGPAPAGGHNPGLLPGPSLGTPREAGGLWMLRGFRIQHQSSWATCLWVRHYI